MPTMRWAKREIWVLPLKRDRIENMMIVRKEQPHWIGTGTSDVKMTSKVLTPLENVQRSCRFTTTSASNQDTNGTRQCVQMALNNKIENPGPENALQSTKYSPRWKTSRDPAGSQQSRRRIHILRTNTWWSLLGSKQWRHEYGCSGILFRQ